MKLINVELIKHPLNWVIILVMLIIAGATGHLILSYLGIEPATDGEAKASNGQVAVV